MKYTFKPLDTSNLPEIKSPKIWHRKKLHPEGLFSLHREKFGKIVLPFPLPNPLFEDIWVDLIKEEKGWDWEAIKSLSQDQPKVWEIGEYLREQNLTHRSLPLWIQDIPVVPWMYRTSTGDTAEPEMRHFLNFHYARILDRIRKIRKLSELQTDYDWRFESLILYKAVRGLFLDGTSIYGLEVPSLMSLLTGKEGIPRHFLSAYHIDYSARAVIVPTLEVAPEEVMLPQVIAEKIFYPWIWYESKMRKIAINPELIKEVSNNRWVVINRQPTLHKYSIMAFRVKVWSDPNVSVLGIHPSIVQPFNADFDGDTMAIWPVFADEAQKDLENKLALRHHVRNRTGSYQISPRQDYLYALYHLTFSLPTGSTLKITSREELWQQALQDPARTVEYLDKTNSAGRRLVEVLMDDKVTIDKPIDKKYLQTLLTRLNYEGEAYLDLIDRLHQIHPWAKMEFSLQDLIAYMDGDRSLDNSLVKIVVSGARASFDQLDMMSIKRGIVPVWNDELCEIDSSFAEGLTLPEFYALSHQSRRSLIDKGITVSDPGYLSRRLFLATVAIQATHEPCSTEPLTVPAHLESKLQGMYYVKAKDTISLYWVANCNHEATKICVRCFGHYLDKTIPEAKALIGAEISGYLSEPTTQMTLRVFHTGGLIGENHYPVHIPEPVKFTAIKDQWAICTTEAGKEYLVYIPKNYKITANIGDIIEPGYKFFSKLSSLEITQAFPELEKSLELYPGWGVITPEPGTLELYKEDEDLIVQLHFVSGRSLRLKLSEDHLITYPSGTHFEAYQILISGPLHHSLLQYWAQYHPKSISLAWSLMVSDIYERAGIRIPLNYLGVLARSLFRDGQYLSLKKAMSDPLDKDLISRFLSERVKAKFLDYIEGAQEGLMTRLARGLPLLEDLDKNDFNL